MKHTIVCLLFLTTALGPFVLKGQTIDINRDPRINTYLSPTHNPNLNPENNAAINPRMNWKINPVHTPEINPANNTSINPMNNQSVNPMQNQLINPLLTISLHPKNMYWRGMHLFNKDDSPVGFLSVASQYVLICFDIKGEWTCYFIKTPAGTYNQLNLKGEWTGQYLCPDGLDGYNLFAADGIWTGKYVK